MGLLRRITRGLLLVLATAYAFGMAVLALLWTVLPSHPWWLALSNVFAPHLFLPLLALLPLAALVRLPGLRVAALLPLIVFLLLFGAGLVPSPPRLAPAQSTPLRVVTFNQLYSNRSFGKMVAAIRAQQADLVAVQELSGPMAETISRELIDLYPYQLLDPAEADYGLGLLSRYPIISEQYTSDFLGQQAVIEVAGQPVTLLNIHLSAPSVNARRLRQLRDIPLFRAVPLLRDYNTSRRSREVPALLEQIDRTAGPLVVLGDFNTGDREPPYIQLAARLHDAYRETAWGFGFTFPNHKRYQDVPLPVPPLVRIDYIWSRGGILPRAAHVECRNGNSDHCMMVADLALVPENEYTGGVGASLPAR